MASGSKWLAVTVPLAAFLGSGVGVVLAPWATEQIRVRTGVDLAARSAPDAVAVAVMPPVPARVLPSSGGGAP